MTEPLLNILMVCWLLVMSQLSPGPDVFFVFRTALSQGFRSGAAVAFGINLGFLIQCAIACTAGAWVMEQDWSWWVLLAASCWLLYLAWKIFPRSWKTKEDQLGNAPMPRESLLSLTWQGFLCNILNPKCLLFIMGLTLDPIRHYGMESKWFAPLLIASLYITSLAGWWLWCALLQWKPIRSCYVRHVNIIDAAFALLLAAFALLLLLK